MRGLAAVAVILLAAAGGTASNDVEDPARRLLDEGERLWRAGAFKPARAVLGRALDLSRRLPGRAPEALALNLLGNLADEEGGPSGGELHQRALDLARAMGDGRLEARVLADIGLGHWRRAEYEQALDHHQRALALQEALGDLEGQAVTLDYMGRVHVKKGEYEQAGALYDRALARAAGSARTEAVILEDLALSALDRRAYSQALAYYQRALATREAEADTAGQGRLLGSIGYLYLLQGANGEALAHFRRALQLAREAGDTAGRASALSKLGGVHARLGRTRQALDYYAAAVLARREVGDAREEAWALARTAAVLRRLNRTAEALRHYLQALAIWERILDRRALGWHLGEVALTYEEMGDAERALVFHRRALQLGEEIQLPYVSLMHGRIGRLLARQGEGAQALVEGRRAVESALESHNPEMRWSAAYDVGSIRRALGDRVGALQSFRESLALIEALRAEASPVDEARAAWLEDKQEVFADTIALLVEQGQEGEALEVAERARARALVDLLSGRGGEEVADVPPPDLAHLREEARRRAVTFLEYFTARDRTFIWVIGPDGTVHGASSALGREAIARQVVAMRRALKADVAARDWDDEVAGPDPAAVPPVPDPRAVLRRLHRGLIEPVERWLPDDPRALVTVVPHGKTFLVSFGALLDSSGRYLVETHTLSYAPAISLLQYTGREVRTPGPARVLVVGNPVMPVLPERRRALPPLPEAEHEAKAIAALFPPDQVTALLGRFAEEGRVRELAPEHTILHFATHGVVRDDAPLDSLLALSPSAEAGPGGDGLWTAREVFSLHLKADLVTLSACNTGLGRVTGDGVLGLSRAFLYAGTPSLVVSLWRVADGVTAAEMEEFYRQLRRNGGDKAAALRQAQLTTLQGLRQGRFRTPSGRVLREQPSYWAPFVLVGEAR